MPAAPDRIRLEPLPAPVMAVALAHVLLGMLIWILLPLWQEATRGEAANPELVWMSPDNFLPPAQKAAPAPPAAPPSPPPVPAKPAVAPKPPPAAVSFAKSTPLRAANKYITLSPLLPETEGPPAPPKPYQPVPTLLDIAAANKTSGSTGMGAVDEAIQQTYLKEWVAPSTHLVPPGQRSAVVNLSIARDGTILEATLAKTGAPALNVSISQLLQRVTKIPVSLPSSFRKQRYDLQVNFQIE